MGNLTQEKLKADDCNKLIISMWFKLPDKLPIDDSVTGQDSITGQDAAHDSRVHEYILMEFGGYTQIPEKRFYPFQWSLITLAYGSPPPYFDPAANPGPGFGYGKINGVFHGEPFGISGDAWTGSGAYSLPHIVLDKNEKLGQFEYDLGTFGDFPGNYGGGTNQGWGLNSPRGIGSVTDLYGPPTIGTTSELWVLEYKPFETTYYNYNAPSTIWISGGGFIEDPDNPTASGPSAENSLWLGVRIAGAVTGPYNAGQSNAFDQLNTLVGVHGTDWQGQTFVPSLTIRCPIDGPTSDDSVEVGTPRNPYITLGKWHHMLCCVDLGASNMARTVTAVETETPIYNPCTMWVLIDGVKYGGTPWPPFDESTDFNPDEGAPVTESHEYPLDYTYPPTFPPNVSPSLLDTSFNTRNGVQINTTPFHIPYDPRWKRFTDSWDIVTWHTSSVIGQEFFNYSIPIHGDTGGWKPGDQSLTIPLPYTGSAEPDSGHDILVRGFPNPALQWEIPTNENAPKTVDIKRRYSDVQIWFGKYVDPTDYNNLKLFLDITRNDEGKLVGNKPALDQAALDAYSAAQADDPNVKVLSLAAAPNHLGKPDVYLAGGHTSFVIDKGKEGDTLDELGTIKDTPGPADIPIPESAVKPLGL